MIFFVVFLSWLLLDSAYKSMEAYRRTLWGENLDDVRLGKKNTQFTHL